MSNDSTTREQIEHSVHEYERGVNEGDLALVMSLFTEDAVFYDPVGWMDEFKDVAELQPERLQPAFRGHEGLEQFFDGSPPPSRAWSSRFNGCSLEMIRPAQRSNGADTPRRAGRSCTRAPWMCSRSQTARSRRYRVTSRTRTRSSTRREREELFQV